MKKYRYIKLSCGPGSAQGAKAMTCSGKVSRLALMSKQLSWCAHLYGK